MKIIRAAITAGLTLDLGYIVYSWIRLRGGEPTAEQILHGLALPLALAGLAVTLLIVILFGEVTRTRRKVDELLARLAAKTQN